MMADKDCNKFSKKDDGKKESVVCFNCGNSDIYSKETVYCSCCGSPLAILGLPKAGQVEIPDDYFSNNGSNIKTLKTKLFNAGSIPLEISFDYSNLPKGLKINPIEAIIKPGSPEILKFSSDGYFSNKLGDIEDLLPSQEFDIELSSDALEQAQNEGIKININTNAKKTNQRNLDNKEKPYLFI